MMLSDRVGTVGTIGTGFHSLFFRLSVCTQYNSHPQNQYQRFQQYRRHACRGESPRKGMKTSTNGSNSTGGTRVEEKAQERE